MNEAARKINLDYMGTNAKIDTQVAQNRNERDRLKMDRDIDMEQFVNNMKQNYYTQKRIDEENRNVNVQNLAKSLNQGKLNNRTMQELMKDKSFREQFADAKAQEDWFKKNFPNEFAQWQAQKDKTKLGGSISKFLNYGN
jgi:hypothetical protein